MDYLSAAGFVDAARTAAAGPGQLFMHLRAVAFAADRTCLSCSALSTNG